MGTAGRSRNGRIPQGPSSAPAGAPPPFHQPATSAPRRPFPPGPPAARVAGPCFACGEMGHIRLHCPKMAAGGAESTRRWYPFEGESEWTVNKSVMQGMRPLWGWSVLHTYQGGMWWPRETQCLSHGSAHWRGG